MTLAIAFLFNHDAPHQVAHTAPIVSALLELDPAISVSIVSSTAEQEIRARECLPSAGSERLRFLRLRKGAATRAALGAGPLRRIAGLVDNRALLDGFDAIVVPETTSSLLRTHLGVRHPALIYLPHGAGDRAVGFRRVTRQFDLVLLAGPKVRDRMLEAGIITESGHAVVGYPKFDAIDLDERIRLFAGDRPTVLYNPHFDPRLSSWWAMGYAVLDWFRSQQQYDFVFAPHVMLFKKRLHASVEHRQLRWREPLPPRFASGDHLIFDTGSSRSIDMTYTRAADIYIGDASSQVYEFLLRPRPCIFLNPARLAWRGDPNFAHWNLGQVIETIEELPEALARAEALQQQFEPAQRAAIAATFDLSERKSSERAAQAILDWLRANRRGRAA